MKMKNENESSDYPRTYLEPSELYILKKLILLGRDASKSKQQAFTIYEFMSHFDHRTVEPLYPKRLSYYTDAYTPAILITRFLYDLSKNGFIKFCDSLGRPGKLVLKKEGRKIVAELLAFAKHPNGGVEPYIYRIDTDFKFKIEFIEPGTKRMKQWLSKYLDLYIDNNLPSKASGWNRKEFYSYVDALAFFHDLFKEKYEVPRDQSIRLKIAELIPYKNEWEGKTPLSGSSNWLDHWFDEPILRPIETILAMEKQGLLEIVSMCLDEIVITKFKLPVLPEEPKPPEVLKSVSQHETPIQQNQPKIRLSSVNIKYRDKEAVLEIGGQRCSMPPYKNEHYFCRAMHGTDVKVNEPMDWDIVYAKMTGCPPAIRPEEDRNKWRVVYDAMEALNNRIKEAVNTNDELFSWQEKTVKRNH